MVTKWQPLPIKEGGTDGTTPKSARRALGISEGVSSDNFVSVKDFPFGAVGDGVTDDTAAIVAALAAASFIYFPAGTYKCTSAITIAANKCLFGAGREVSILLFSGAINGLNCTFVSQTAANLVLRDIQLQGTSSGLNLLKLDNASLISLQNVKFRIAGLSSIISDNTCIMISLKDVYFSEASTAFWNVNTGLTSIVHFDSCQFNTDTTPPVTVIANSAAILVAASASFAYATFTNTNQNGGSTNGMGSFIRNSGAMTAILDNCYIEFTAKACILAAGAGVFTHLIIRGGNFHCIDGSNAAAIDLNNAQAHVNVSIRNLAGAVSAALDVFKPGGTVNYDFIDGNRSVAGTFVTGFGTEPRVTKATGGNSHIEKVGSFTGTLTGCTTSPTGTLQFISTRGSVTLKIPTFTGTSNTTACTITGMPSEIFPAASQVCIARYTDNGVTAIGFVGIDTAGVITFFNAATSSTFFTAAGTKGSPGTTLSYLLD